MRVTKTEKSPTQVILRIEADDADLTPIKNHVLGHFKNRLDIPGFRQGNAPLNVLEKHVNRQQLLDEFMEHALNRLYSRAVEHEKLRPIAQPEVSLKQFVPFTTLIFDIELQTIGQIRLPDYRQIRLAKKLVSVSSKDVNEVIKTLQERMAERKEVDRPAKSGDEAVIDFKGKDSSGQLVNGASGQDYPLLIGGTSFIPGFEEHLVGVKPGQKKTFSTRFPKNYSVKALQSQDITFTVALKKLNELTKPKADKAFATKAGPFKTLAELKADVKKQITLERQREADRAYADELLKKIVDRSTVEAPEILINEQVEQMEAEERRNLSYRGQTWQEHLEEETISEEEHRQRQRPNATQRVKTGLVLSEIATKENIEVTAEEQEAYLQVLKSQYKDPAMLAELDKTDNQSDLKARLMSEKTIQKLVSYAAK